MTNGSQIATHNLFFFLDFHGHMKSAVTARQAVDPHELERWGNATFVMSKGVRQFR
jgi:hypothetical protein